MGIVPTIFAWQLKAANYNLEWFVFLKKAARHRSNRRHGGPVCPLAGALRAFERCQIGSGENTAR